MHTDVNAVLFDLDGTLVNTIPLILECYRYTLATHLPGVEIPEKILISNLGRSLEAILHDYAVAGGAADPDALSHEMAETYRSFQRRNLDRLILPYPDVREALSGLRDRGFRLGVVTSKVEWAAKLTYERYGLQEFLSVFVFHDDTERHKPDPEPLTFAAMKGGLVPAHTAYVGDSVHDMAAGRAAGMRAVGALWGPSEPGELERAGANVLAASPLDLLAIFS